MESITILAAGLQVQLPGQPDRPCTLQDTPHPAPHLTTLTTHPTAPVFKCRTASSATWPARSCTLQDIPDPSSYSNAHSGIQDCEFSYLASQILHLLGTEGPHTADPAKYIRYIYNRVILENATVRAAAVSSLAAFGAHCANLRPRVLTLLQRALFDNDDEVRLV